MPSDRSEGRPANVFSLVADIGGTNTRVALADGPRLLPDTVRRYRNADYPGLESVLRRFLDDEGGVDCKAACVAVAGPVRNGRGTLTNLDWTIDETTLARAAQAETVALINDLQAQGHALGRLDSGKLRPVIEGPTAPPNEAQLVIGVGTGFNIAPVFHLGTGRFVTAAEAGHANMPIRTQADFDLCTFVETAHGFPGIEDVLSGRGLERIYAWLGERQGTPGERHAAEIMAACADDTDPRATEAVATFVRILGTVAGNLALIHLPFGGVFLAGGVARAITPYLDVHGFGTAFRDKGRFSGFMQNFGVWVVEDDFAALTGSAAYLDQIVTSQRTP
jgi:glucokinase